MRRTLLLLPVFCFLTTGSFAQRTLKDIDENKYRINLPEYWGKNSKVVRILMDKLPLLSEEIKDKEICGDGCNPAYNIDFYLSYPEIINQDLNNKHTGQAATVQRTAIMPPLSRSFTDYRTIPELRAVATRSPVVQSAPQKWEVETLYRFECFLVLKDRNEKIIDIFILVDSNEIWASSFQIEERSSLITEIQQNPLTFLDKNKDKFFPNIYEQLNIVDTQILNLQ